MTVAELMESLRMADPGMVVAIRFEDAGIEYLEPIEDVVVTKDDAGSRYVFELKPAE